MAKTYTAIVERCPETNLYVGHVPGFRGAHSQAATLDELNANLREVIELLTEERCEFVLTACLDSVRISTRESTTNALRTDS